VSITRWLQATEWNKTTAELLIGVEVTVDGELSGEAINRIPGTGAYLRPSEQQASLRACDLAN